MIFFGKMSGYIYLIREREFVNSEKNVYKIGRSTQADPFQRLKSYKIGYELILLIKVDDCVNCEKELIVKLTKEFDIQEGKESFEGDVNKMYSIIISHINSKPIKLPAASETKIDISGDEHKLLDKVKKTPAKKAAAKKAAAKEKEPELQGPSKKQQALEKLKSWLKEGEKIKPVNIERYTEVFSNYPVCVFKDGDNTIYEKTWDKLYIPVNESDTDYVITVNEKKYFKTNSDSVPTPEECDKMKIKALTWFDIAVKNHLLYDYVEYGIYIDDAPNTEIINNLMETLHSRSRLEGLKVYVISSDWILAQKQKPSRLQVTTLIDD